MIEPSSEQKAILKARAQQLARAPIDRLAEGDALEVVEFLLAGEHYAVESTAVREVHPVRELTPLPCTPSFVLGIMNVRGQILAVVDLRRFFDLSMSGLTDLNKVVILRSGDMELGILADAVIGVRVVPRQEIQPPPPTFTGRRTDYLHGVTVEGLIVLDAGRIAADGRIVVHEEVES
jgi:purine-binding chemotaxis protein CheW